MERDIDKKTFLYMLGVSLENAPITNDDLAKKVNEIHRELSENSRLTSDTYMGEFDKKMAEYVYSKYDSVVLTTNEKVVGIKGGIQAELFDATDCKAHLDF